MMNQMTPLYLGPATAGEYAWSGRAHGFAAPSSGTLNIRQHYFPITVLTPATLYKAFVLNGATQVSTEYWQVALYEDTTAGPGRLVASSPVRASQGTANRMDTVDMGTIPHPHTPVNFTSNSTTDGTTYSLGSTVFRANRMYTLQVTNAVNSGTPGTISSITTNGGPTWTSRDTVEQHVGIAAFQRTTLFTAISTSDVQANPQVNWGATQHSFSHRLWEWWDVDTTTNDGLVQTANNTASASTAPSVTLSAFGNANNATMVHFSWDQSQVATANGSIFEIHDYASAITPNIYEWSGYAPGNDTTPDATTAGSTTWVGIAAEVKALSSPRLPFIAPGRYWISFMSSGTTATYFRTSLNATTGRIHNPYTENRTTTSTGQGGMTTAAFDGVAASAPTVPVFGFITATGIA